MKHPCSAQQLLAFCFALLMLIVSAQAEKDIPAAASVLAPSGSSSGTMTETSPGVFDTYDWYTVTTTTEGTLTLTAQSSGGLDLQIYMYYMVSDMQDPNSGGSYIGGGGSATLDTVSASLRPCTVYIQLVRRSGTGSYSISSTFHQAALSTDAENNDTPTVANTLAVNASTTGHMGYYSYALGTDTYDWYKVTIPSDGKFTVLSKTSDGNLNLQLYIYRSVTNMHDVNSSGDYIGGGGDSASDTVVDFLRATTVYIEVIRRSGVGSYALQTVFTPAALTDDAENNDTPSVANTLGINATITGHMGYFSAEKGMDSYDWYKITTPSDGRLTVYSQTSDGDLNLQLYIYRTVSDMHSSNPGGNYVGGGGTQVYDTVVDRLDPRTVYVQVIRRSGIGSYSLQTVFAPAASANDIEPNDIPAQAQTIPVDSARTGHLGYFKSDLTSDTYDWYKVVVPSARTLKFVSKTYDGDLDLQLYIYKTVSDMNNGNPSGDYTGGGGTATDDTVSTDVTAGTYYLQVIRRTGIGSYALACGSALLTDAHNPLLAAVKSVPLGVFPQPGR